MSHSPIINASEFKKKIEEIDQNYKLTVDEAARNIAGAVIRNALEIYSPLQKDQKIEGTVAFKIAKPMRVEDVMDRATKLMHENGYHSVGLVYKTLTSSGPNGESGVRYSLSIVEQTSQPKQPVNTSQLRDL